MAAASGGHVLAMRSPTEVRALATDGRIGCQAAVMWRPVAVRTLPMVDAIGRTMETRRWAAAARIPLAAEEMARISLNAVVGNCATIVSFRVSGDDAKALVREFAASGEGPQTGETMFDLVLPASELQNLPDYNCYVRTLADGRPEEAFLVKSLPPLSNSGRSAAPPRLIQASLQRFGRDRKTVEERIDRFLSKSEIVGK